MTFMSNMFNVFLTKDQRERTSRSQWEKSVAAAAKELGLDTTKTTYGSCPPTPLDSPTNTTTSATARIMPSRLITSCPMTPELSSSSSASPSSSGICSPTRSRPGSAYSTSPRPGLEFRRHTSITRNPISYDCLINAKTEKEKPRRCSSDTVPRSQPLLFSLPPLEPMEGVGKYRRVVNVSADYLNALERDTLHTLEPLFPVDDTRLSRWRRSTTTPPRAYSSSPNEKDLATRQAMFSSDVEKWTTQVPMVDPIVLDEEEDDAAFEDVPDSPEQPRVARPTRPQVKRTRTQRSGDRKTRVRTQGGLSKANLNNSKVNLNKKAGYKPKGPPKETAAMSASMETLVSGEE